MKQRKKLAKVTISFLVAVLLALQGTGPIFVQAKEIVQDVSQEKEFARPEALTEEEAGINDSSAENQQKDSESTKDNQTRQEKGTESDDDKVILEKEPADENESEETDTEEKEVELKEPQDYYPIPEEPEGELIDYDAVSKTYKTGDKQYTTVYGGYVGTYKNEDGDT